MISVLVVDDHTLFRLAVTTVINTQPDMKVVAEASNGTEAIKVARELHPDIILMDLNMPEMSGTETTQYLLKEMPESNVLILTISEKDEDLIDALKAGAKGYLLKGADPDELVRAVFHVAQGGVIISPYMAPKLLAEIGTHSSHPQEEADLSPREVEILDLVGHGLSDKQISEKLFISLNTVKTHMKNILAKLHVKSRTEAVFYASKVEAAQEGKGG